MNLKANRTIFLPCLQQVDAMARPTKHKDGWRVRYTNEMGKQQHGGVYPSQKDALFHQKKLETEAQEILRGIKEGRPLDKTFGDLCDYYLEKITPQKRRQRDDRSMIETHLRAFFGNVKLVDLENHIDDYKFSRSHLSPKTLHKHLTLFMSMCRIAQKKPLRWIRVLPEITKPTVRLFERDFRYLRNDAEISKFLISAHEENTKAYALYATAIYTGMRQGELAGLQWDDVDFVNRLVTIQRSYIGPTKARDVRYVPILDPLLPVLREWKLQSCGQHVFPSDSGTMLRDSARIFQEVFHRVLDRAGFEKTERHGKLLRYVTFHDLRHTFASQWVMKGGNIFKLQKILGHKEITMTMRYSHLAPDAFKEDLDRFGCTAPRPTHGEVIEFHQKS